MKNIISAEICKKCGECCKNFPFVELSKKDINSLEQLTALHPDLFTNQKEQVVEEYFLQFKENGDCFFLNNKKGSYSCGVYAARPGICRKYPSEPIQKKTCNAHMGKMLKNKRPGNTRHLTAFALFSRHFVATLHLLPFAKYFKK